MKGNYFGLMLRRLRQEKNISQRKLGEMLDVCNQTISFWETGSREPDLDTLVKLSNIFEVSIDFMLNNKEL